MRILSLLLATFMAAQALAAEPEFLIDATASISSIREVIKQVRKVDKRPILSITQRMIEKNPEEIPSIEEYFADPHDKDSMIVDVGVINGPRNGAGRNYYFRRIRGRWFLTKSESWVS